MQFKTPEFWQRTSLASLLLTPLSWLYLLFHRIIKNTSSPVKFNKKLICIGNLNVGGAGKTPFAICLGRAMQEQGLNIAFASKNYIGSYPNAKQIESSDTAESVSDEPLLLAKVAPSFIARSRKEAIALACSSEADYIIVDDGLQSNKISYDYKIIVVDAVVGFGNKKLLPAGPLRDTLDCLKEVDLIIQVGGDINSIPELGQFQSKLHIVNRHFSHNLDLTKRYLAFAGIAYPAKFFNSLREIGADVVKTVSFPDHYKYTYKDMARLKSLAKQFDAELVTTEKDLVKIDKDILALKMMLEFNDSKSEAKIIKAIDEKS